MSWVLRQTRRRAQAIVDVVHLWFAQVITFCPDRWCGVSRLTRDTWSRSTSWYRKECTQPTSWVFDTGNYTGWNRRDTRGASSSGYEDRYATWRGANVHEIEHEDDKNKDKDNALRRGQEREAEKEAKEKRKRQTHGEVHQYHKRGSCGHCRGSSTAGKQLELYMQKEGSKQ